MRYFFVLFSIQSDSSKKRSREGGEADGEQHEEAANKLKNVPGNLMPFFDEYLIFFVCWCVSWNVFCGWYCFVVDDFFF